MEYLRRNIGKRTDLKIKIMVKFMNTIKIPIFTYRWQLLLMCIFSQILGIINLIYIAIAGTPSVNNSNTCAIYDMFILYFLIASVVSVVAQELRSQTNSMLPTSLLRKYTTALGTVMIYIISCLLFSLVVESIGLILTAGSPEEAKFALGGYITYLSESTNGFSNLVLFLALAILVATLVKHKDISMAINYGLCGVAIAFRSMDFSPTLYSVIWCIAIIVFMRATRYTSDGSLLIADF